MKVLLASLSFLIGLEAGDGEDGLISTQEPTEGGDSLAGKLVQGMLQNLKSRLFAKSLNSTKLTLPPIYQRLKERIRT